MMSKPVFRDEFTTFRPATRHLPVRMKASKPIHNVRLLSCSRTGSKWKCLIQGTRFSMFVENKYVSTKNATSGMGESGEIYFSWERPATCSYDQYEDEMECR